MLIQTTINHIRIDLINEFEQSYIPSRIKLGYGNIYQVGVIHPIHQEGNQYIQLAYEGTIDSPRWGGGNFSRNWLLGVGIYTTCEQDVLDQNVQASEDLIYIARSCIELIHLYDDFEYETPTTAEPIQFVHESSPDIVLINNKLHLVVRQQYRVINPVYDYDSFKTIDGTPLDTGTGGSGTI